jgi:hypothetical protein
MAKKSKAQRKEKRAEKKVVRKEKIKKVTSKIKAGTKKVLNKIKDVSKNMPFAPLLPFAVAMRQILKGKKVEPEKDFLKLCQQFHAVVIEKKSTYELAGNYEHIAAAAVTAVIAGVLKFFKSLKDKKQRGEELSVAEEQALTIAENSTDLVMDAAKEEVEDEAVKKAFPVMAIVIIVLVVVIAAALLLGKKKK